MSGATSSLIVTRWWFISADILEYGERDEEGRTVGEEREGPKKETVACGPYRLRILAWHDHAGLSIIGFCRGK